MDKLISKYCCREGRGALWVYGGVVVAVMAAALLLQPVFDDWFFLRYFGRSAQWSIGEYHWLYDCHWLKRDYWRPLEDAVLFWEAAHPWLFPWLQHVMVVALAAGCGLLTYRLGVAAGASRRAMGWTLAVCFPASTNMGALLSPDSWTQVMAVFWGLMSVWIYSSKTRWRMPLWVLASVLACLSKESGFVFIIAGPLYRVVVENASGKRGLGSRIRGEMSGIVAACLLTGVYLGVYFLMSRLQGNAVLSAAGTDGLPATVADELFQSRQSHALTPVTFVKNLAILYGLGIYPVAVNGFYYHDYWVVAVTLLAGCGGPVLVWRAWRSADGSRRRLAASLLALAVVVSLPSLVTRAGEISPFASNMLVMTALGVLFSGYSLRRADRVFLALFVASTLVADGYKYSLVYEGGGAGREMAREIVALSPERPSRVLWVGVDESGDDRAGGAFTRSPYRGFDCGSAAIREYGYRYPVRLDKIKIEPGSGADSAADSIARARAVEYDCVWVTRGNKVRVYQSKQ